MKTTLILLLVGTTAWAQSPAERDPLHEAVEGYLSAGEPGKDPGAALAYSGSNLRSLRFDDTLWFLCLAEWLADEDTAGEEKKEPEKKEAREAEKQAAPELPPITVFGERIPGSIYQYDVAQDDRTKTEHVGQALQRVPGFHLLDEHPTGLWSNVGVRGISPLRSRGILTLLDGAPSMISLFGDNDWHVLPSVEQLERIEVVKGGSSVLYGPGAIGGVVNFVTRSVPEDPTAVLRTTFGSDGLFIAEAGGGGMFGDIGFYVRHTHRQTDGWRDHSALRSEDTHLKFRIRAGTSDDLRITLNHFQSLSDTPGALSPDEYRQNPKQSFTPNDDFRGRRFSLNIQHSHHINERSSLHTTLYAQRMERRWQIARRSTTSVDIWDLGGTFAGIEPKYFLKWDGPFWGRNELTAGFRFHVERSDRTKMVGVTPTARTGPVTVIDVWTAVEFAPYVQNDFELFEDFWLNLGLRLESYRLGIQNRIGGAKGQSSVFEAIWGVGVRYIIGASTIFASVNRYLDPPQPQQEIDSTTGQRRNLKNAFVLNYEIGIRSDHLKWLPVDFTLFQLDYDDQIVRQGLDYFNVDRSLHRGAELAFTFKGGVLVPDMRGWELFGNATLLDTRMETGQYAGNEMPYAPPRMFNGGIRYTRDLGRSRQVSAHFEGIFTGRQFSDAANTVAETPDGAEGVLNARWVFNLGFSYENEEKGLSVFAGIKNVFDRRYVAMRWAWWGGLFPGAGRSFYIGISKRF